MQLGFPTTEILRKSGGADPLVCAGPPGPAASGRSTLQASGSRPGGRPQTRGSAPQLAQLSCYGKLSGLGPRPAVLVASINANRRPLLSCTSAGLRPIDTP